MLYVNQSLKISLGKGGRFLATINPVTYVLQGMRELILEGWSWEAMASATGSIGGLAVFTLPLTLAALRWRTSWHRCYKTLPQELFGLSLVRRPSKDGHEALTSDDIHSRSLCSYSACRRNPARCAHPGYCSGYGVYSSLC